MSSLVRQPLPVETFFFNPVELVGGRLHVAANDGTGIKEVMSSAGYLNDNNWHEVIIEQKPNNQYHVIVDQKFRDILQFE